MPDNKPQWKQTAGLAADSTVAQVVCSEQDKQDWKDEADDRGYSSLSKYLYDLIRLGKAEYEDQFLDRHRLETELEELQEENEQLRQRLADQEKRRGGRLEVDDAPFLQRFLTDQYKELDEILQEIVESGALNEMLRKRVEDELYVLAQQGTVEYERGWGWKQPDTTEGR